MNKSVLSENSKVNWLFLGLVFIGVFIRLFWINHLSLWIDEVNNLEMARELLRGNVTHWGMHLRMPLYYCFLGLMQNISENILWLKAVHMFPSLLLIFVTGVAGKQIGGLKTGLASAAVISMMPAQIFQSWQINRYAILALIHAEILRRFVKARSGGSDYWRWAFFAFLSVWLHIFSWFVIFPQFLIVIADYFRGKLKNIGKILLPFGMIILSVIPWIIIVEWHREFLPTLMSWSEVSLDESLNVPTLKEISGIGLTQVYPLQIQLTPDRESAARIMIVFMIFLIAFVLIRKRATHKADMKVFQIFIMPVVLLLICNLFVNIFTHRFMMAVSPAFAILCGVVLSGRFGRTIGLICALILSLTALPPLYTMISSRVWWEGWREAQAYLSTDEYIQNKQLPIFHAFKPASKVYSYYECGGLADFNNNRHKVILCPEDISKDFGKVEKKLIRLAEVYDEAVWLEAKYHARIYDENMDMAQIVNRYYTVEEIKDFGTVTAYHLTLRE